MDKIQDISRETLCEILHFYLRDMHVSYLESPSSTTWREKELLGIKHRENSRDLKKTQKVLEYLRKNYKYSIDKYVDDIFDIEDIRISVIGRNTWKKIEKYEFDISISNDDFEHYGKIANRKLKIKELIN